MNDEEKGIIPNIDMIKHLSNIIDEFRHKKFNSFFISYVPGHDG